MSWLDDDETIAERERIRDERIKQREAEEAAERAAEIEMLRLWTANETYLYATRHVKHLCPDFQFDKHSKELFEKFSLYHSKDIRYEQRGHGSLNKGLFVSGSPGTGKTLAMRAFSKQKRNCYEIKSAMSIVDEFQLRGLDELTKYCTKHFNDKRNWYSNPKYYNQDLLGTCFDDLGVEDIPAVHFGQKVNVFEKIISYRYEMGFFHLTHFTSNFGPDEIEERYGTRVRSRLREMCNFIVLPGTDRRK